MRPLSWGRGPGSPSCTACDTKVNPVTLTLYSSPAGRYHHPLNPLNLLNSLNPFSKSTPLSSVACGTPFPKEGGSGSSSYSTCDTKGKHVTLTIYSSPPKAAIPQPSGRSPVKPKNLKNLRAEGPSTLSAEVAVKEAIPSPLNPPAGSGQNPLNLLNPGPHQRPFFPVGNFSVPPAAHTPRRMRAAPVSSPMPMFSPRKR